jgi:hypothetical protein
MRVRTRGALRSMSSFMQTPRRQMAPQMISPIMRNSLAKNPKIRMQMITSIIAQTNCVVGLDVQSKSDQAVEAGYAGGCTQQVQVGRKRRNEIRFDSGERVACGFQSAITLAVEFEEVVVSHLSLDFVRNVRDLVDELHEGIGHRVDCVRYAFCRLGDRIE